MKTPTLRQTLRLAALLVAAGGATTGVLKKQNLTYAEFLDATGLSG